MGGEVGGEGLDAGFEVADAGQDGPVAFAEGLVGLDKRQVVFEGLNSVQDFLFPKVVFGCGPG